MPCRATFLDAQLTEERKTVDLKVIEKYREKKSDLDKKQAELAEVTERRNAARGEHDELRKKRLEEFMHGFGIISTKLQEIYQMITIGGDAELSVVDSLDPFSEVCTWLPVCAVPRLGTGASCSLYMPFMRQHCCLELFGSCGWPCCLWPHPAML